MIVGMSDDDALAGWSFEVFEVADGVHLGIGVGPTGGGVRATGEDPDTTLNTCREDALKFVAGILPSTPNLDASETATYRMRCRLRDGTYRELPIGIRRRRDLGDQVNLPMGPDGSARPGKGYLWRVSSVDDGGETLILDFDRPHSKMWL
jgi:hypothetical protein